VLQRQPRDPPVLRHERHAGPQRLPRATRPERLATEQDLAPQRPGRARAVQGLEQLRAPGAEQPADTDDLAPPHTQADPVGFPPPGPLPPGHQREVGDTQDLLPRLGVPCAEHGLHRPADHGLGRGLGGHVPRVEPGDHGTVAQHGGPVGDAADLVHPVGDVDDPDPGPAQLGDHREHLLDLDRRERGGRFVHDEHPGVERQRLGDRHQLLLTGAQLTHRPPRIERDTAPLQEPPGHLVRAPPVDRAQPGPQLAAEEDVLRHREPGHEVQLLVDHGDPGPLRIGGRGEPHRHPIDRDRPLVVGDVAGEDLHERRLARPVLPEQRVHLTGPDREVDVAAGVHTTVRLADADHLDQRVDSVVHAPSSPTVSVWEIDYPRR
jgi:hypothetical protein